MIVIKKAGTKFKEIISVKYSLKFQSKDVCFIAINDDNSIVGLIIFNCKKHFTWSTLQVYKKYDPEIFINSLFVEEYYRGVGIGKKLFEYVISKYNRIGLATSYYENGTNSVAFNMYKSANFKVISNRTNWNCLYWYFDKNVNIISIEYDSSTYLQKGVENE